MATDTTAPGAVAASSAPAADAEPPTTGGRRIAILLPVALFLVAATLRFYGLGYPERIYFDEVYYAPQGQEMITRGVEEGFAVHPPVGKWLIGAGIAVFGYECNDPPAGQLFGGCFGFRAASALAGSLMVVFTYFLGLRLFRRRGVAALAAFFLAIDGLALTMSRISMLDIFLGTFVTLGFWFLMIDRDAMWRDLPDGPRATLPGRSRRWRWLAGVAFGLALATKWSGLLAIAGAGAFVLVSEMLWRRRITGSPWTDWWKIAVSGLLTLVLVPLLVYVLSYAGWFTNFNQTRRGLDQCPNGVCTISTVGIVNEWRKEQIEIAKFHDGLNAEHQYRSHPATWPWLGRPVAYYYESCDDNKLADGKCVTELENVEEILGLGNPMIWWLGLLAFPVLVWFSIKHRDWRAIAILGFYLVQYLPWLAVLRPNFLFYMVPALPFLCLALAYATWRIGANTFLRWVPALVAILTVAAFIFWYPVWSGAEMPRETWQLRMWMPTWI